MAFLTDSLRAAIGAATRLNPFARYGGTTALPGVFGHQMAIAAYVSSGMLRKVIAIPAADRTREWRDWQADKDTIALIEAEEKRLGLRAKVKQAEILRGVGGGALLIITAGDHATPLTPDTIGKGGLVAINVLSRWQIQGRDWVRDVSSADYGQPRLFTISGEGGEKPIHPSRVICFRGEPLPAGSAISDEEAFWGDSRLLRVFAEVQRSDETQTWFAALVKKAKLLRIAIPRLTELVSTADGASRLASRVQLIAESENAMNATITDGGEDGKSGEVISDYQVNWAGIPAVMDAFDQRVSAVSDIPFTRLMGRSPAGMNATGAHDTDNYDRMVKDGQENETRPCLEAIDPALLRSAGVAKPEDVSWKWAPLWTPTEQDEALAFKTFMEAITALQATQTIPDRPFAEAMQNWLEEREYMPGLAAALAKLPEEERFGIAPDDDGTDPSAITHQQGGGDLVSQQAPGGPLEAEPRRRAANDKVTGEDA